MKRKLFVIAGIVLGLTVVTLIGLTLFVKSNLKSDKLKALVIPMAQEVTGRKVDLDSISVSLFEGISIKGIHVKEQDGAADFLAVRELILNYDLMPLLDRKLVISSIKVLEPLLSMRRDEDGRFNFEDMTERQKAEATAKELKTKETDGMPFSVVTNRIAVDNARLEFHDARKELPNVLVVSDADFKIVASAEGGPLKLSGRANIKSIDTVMGNLVIHTSGKIDADADTMTYALSTVVGGDTIAATGRVKNYLTSPDISLDLYCKQINVDRLVALGGGIRQEQKDQLRAPRRPGEDNRGGAESKKKTDIKATGEIKIDSASYNGNTVKNILAKYKYDGGVMTVDPLSLNFIGGGKADISGTLKGALGFRYLSGRGSAEDQIKQTLYGKAVAELSRVEVRQSAIASAMAVFTGLNDLQHPAFNKGHFDFDIKAQKILLSGTMTAPHIRVVPTGNVGFDRTIDLLTDVEVSPEIASRMPTGTITRHLQGKDGWTLIPLKITGTTDKPSVGLNPAALRKTIQRDIQTEIQKRLFDKEPGQERQQKGDNSRDLLKGFFGK